MGLFGSDHRPIQGCHAWYVGRAPAPAWMHPTAGNGPTTALWLVQLLGTALHQERAGAAFRAAGAGLPGPTEVPFDPQVLAGVTAAANPVAARPAPAAVDLDVDYLLRCSFAAIERCCADNGAIAAAPRGAAGEPDYWFCWQRDAAAAATALRTLALTGPADLRDAAAVRLSAYLDFVGGVADLSASRCTMAGEPVRGYGDPQHDGPAATALVLLACGADAAPRFVAHLLALEDDAAGFDLWELRRGRSVHAANLRRRALTRAGIPTELPAWFRPHLPAVLDPDPSWFACTSGLDAGVLGSALLAFDPLVEDLSDPDLIAAVDGVEGHYRSRWPQGGIGRFPEDANDGIGSAGGGAWPITTLWLAQWHLRRGDRDRGVALLSWVLGHTDPAALPEQVDPATGAARGARGLAWAHAELIASLVLV
ncbi:MAG: hypothetical protein ACT4QG_04750 [Sporichthyaceae bacterium]